MSIPATDLPGTYHCSGKVNWLRFAPYVLVTFFVSLVMATCLCLAFDGGFYYFFLAPVIASLPAAGAAYLAVGGGHCRSRAVAGVFGLLAAVLLYVGYFHVHFVRTFQPLVGPTAIYRVDLLPRFISWRMETDAEVDEQGNVQEQPEAMNWFKFGLELLLVSGFVIAAAVVRVGRVYCERCRAWARRLKAHLPPGTARDVERAMRPGCLETLPEIALSKSALKPPVATVTAEYCPKTAARQTSSCPVYLTAKEVANPQNVKDKSGATILDQLEITPEQTQALATKIAALRPLGMGPQPPGAVAPPAEPAAAEGPPSAHVPSATPSPYVESLPAEWGREVLNKKNTTKAVLLSLMPVASAVAGLVMLGLGLWQQPWAPAPDGAVPVVPWLLIGAGTLVAGFGVVVCWKNVDFFNFRLAYRLTRKALQFRPSAAVDPDDPDAIYVDIVPREQWSRIVSDHPSDVGFCKIDSHSRQLLFEGVRERYRIPGEALASCEVEPINPEVGRFGIYVAVIRTRDPAAPAHADSAAAALAQWEAPLLPRPARFGRYGGKQRRELAEQLRDRIRTIMSQDEPAVG